MHAELWSYTENRKRVIAEIRVVGGQMRVEDKEPLDERIRRGLETVWKRSTPETFFKALELDISGTYRWIKLVKD